MKQSLVYRIKELFPGSEVMSRRAFKLLNTRNNYAFFSAIYAIQMVKAVFKRGNSTHFQNIDCFECLPPHKITAY